MALRRDAAGPYQLQAAIAACHANAPDADATDWQRIAALYERLLEVMPHPVVMLNHAIATAMSAGPVTGLELVDRLAESGELRDYHLLYATRADLLRRLGDRTGAAVTYREALERSPSEVERRFLLRRLEELG